MKVCAAPEDIKRPVIDFRNYNHDEAVKQEDQYEADIRKWVADNGYDGPHSGEILSFGVADGYARYVFANGRRSFLIHIDTGDAYQYPDVQYLPKREIINRLQQQAKMRAIFSKK